MNWKKLKRNSRPNRMVYITNQCIDIMKIDTRAEDVVYVTIGDWTIYIDNSTGEKIVEQWSEKA